MNLGLGRGARWWTVVIYALAMAWVEAAVVYYLRSMIGRLEPYQPNPLPDVGGFSQVELVRELATLLMLLTVGLLAGGTWRTRLGYSALAFGVWDIGYYVFLKVICGWPHSLLDWDVLFLLPLPWWGPVLAPMLIATLMIVWGTLVVTAPPRVTERVRGEPVAWLFGAAGAVLALYLFMADSLRVSSGGVEAIRNVLPNRFHWGWFGLALLAMVAPVANLCRDTSQLQLVEKCETPGERQ